MSKCKEIKCDMCKKEIKTYGVEQTNYYDYEPEKEICYYPLPEENAHLVGNYICDECYNNLEKTVRESYIEVGEKFISDLGKRKQVEYNKYLEKVAVLEKENNKIKNYLNILKNINNITELNKDIIHALTHGQYPYVLNGTYFLERAVKIEQEKIEKQIRLTKKSILEWCNEFNIKIKELPKQYNSNSMVMKAEFKNILLDSAIENMTITQSLDLINSI
jgi:hypothetical protein